MSREDNIKGHGLHEISPEKKKAIQSAGGKACGKKRRLIKSLKEAYLEELEETKKTSSGKKLNGFQAVAKAMVREAVSGNVAAAKELAHILGEDIVRIDTSNAIPIQLIDDGLDNAIQ